MFLYVMKCNVVTIYLDFNEIYGFDLYIDLFGLKNWVKVKYTF
jgi:hypothetical protein